MKRLRPLAALVLFLTICVSPTSYADNLADCRIPAAEDQTVSLGFPVRPERLSNLPKAKILVAPFKLKDNPGYIFSDGIKADYLTAAKNISTLSNGRANVEFVFAPTISTDLTNADMDQLKINQREQWQRDETKSTWGFVRKFIADNDAQLDYSGINAVIIEGSSTSRFSDIAEAFMFWENPRNPWFRPIQTNEGKLFNAVLLDNDTTQQTITHEIMHLFGLTDLYGSDTGPGLLSLMASNQINLLSYEKWVLGWLPDSEVTCISNLSRQAITNFSFDNTKVEQLAVIRAPNEDAYIVETTKSGGVKYAAFYSLNNNGRPPITLYREKVQVQYAGSEISDYKAIGMQIKGPNYTLLLTNFESNKISFSIVPTALLESNEFKELADKATQNRSAIDQQVKAAAAELKAKQEPATKAPATQKKTTITCVKGKTTKKVTAVSPKCPTGFKKK
jgi:hypothetical protein